MLDMAKRAGLPWDAILGAELAQAYKPSPEAYLRTAEALMLEPKLFVPPQLSQPVGKPPSGAQWVHEIKLDGYRMAASGFVDAAQLAVDVGGLHVQVGECREARHHVSDIDG